MLHWVDVMLFCCACFSWLTVFSRSQIGTKTIPAALIGALDELADFCFDFKHYADLFAERCSSRAPLTYLWWRETLAGLHYHANVMPSIPRHLLRSKNKISRQLQEGEAKLNFLPLLIFFYHLFRVSPYISIYFLDCLRDEKSFFIFNNNEEVQHENNI